MRALRPAIAVVLLLGVGLSVAARAAAACPLRQCCASAQADDGGCVDLDAAVPQVAHAPVRVEGCAIDVGVASPRPYAAATHVLADAPKTSPPR